MGSNNLSTLSSAFGAYGAMLKTLSATYDISLDDCWLLVPLYFELCLRAASSLETAICLGFPCFLLKLAAARALDGSLGCLVEDYLELGDFGAIFIL